MAAGEFASPETVSALLISVTIFHALAVILTSFRLWFRYHIRRLWWDDFWAALALVGDIVCMVAVWPLTAPTDNPYTNIEALPTRAQSRSTHIIFYWLSIISYTCVIWFSRLSIVLSMVRVVPPARSVSITVFGASVAFICMWVFTLTSKMIACAADKSWYHAPEIQCSIPYWIALSEVCTDTLSDVILVILPFYLLWRVKLPKNQRIMLLSIFSTSILVSVVSAVHTSYIIPSASFIGGATTEMEGAISLIVCNLLVLVTFVYRVIRGDSGFTDTPNKTIPSSNRLTTVDLELSGGSLFTRTTAGAHSSRTGTTFTGTQYTGTDISSLKFASASDKETFGFVLPAPAMAVCRDSDMVPVTTRR